VREFRPRARSVHRRDAIYNNSHALLAAGDLRVLSLSLSFSLSLPLCRGVAAKFIVSGDRPR